MSPRELRNSATYVNYIATTSAATGTPSTSSAIPGSEVVFVELAPSIVPTERKPSLQG